MADVVMPVFRVAGDDLGIAKALMLGSEPDHLLAKFEPLRQAFEQALAIYDVSTIDSWYRTSSGIAHALAIGPTPAHGVLARVLTERDHHAAEDAARRAVALAEATDMLWLQGEQWENLAKVLKASGRVADATEALQTALDRFDRKRATGLADRIRVQLQYVDVT